MEFPELEFVRDMPIHSDKGRQLVVKLYRSRHEPGDLSQPVQSYRWHFGFPKGLVEPIALLLETSPYWGEQHWCVRDDCWLWCTSCVSDASLPLPIQEILASLKFFLWSYNECRRIFVK